MALEENIFANYDASVRLEYPQAYDRASLAIDSSQLAKFYKNGLSIIPGNDGAKIRHSEYVSHYFKGENEGTFGRIVKKDRTQRTFYRAKSKDFIGEDRSSFEEARADILRWAKKANVNLKPSEMIHVFEETVRLFDPETLRVFDLIVDETRLTNPGGRAPLKQMKIDYKGRKDLADTSVSFPRVIENILGITEFFREKILGLEYTDVSRAQWMKQHLTRRK